VGGGGASGRGAARGGTSGRGGVHHHQRRARRRSSLPVEELCLLEKKKKRRERNGERLTLSSVVENEAFDFFSSLRTSESEHYPKKSQNRPSRPGYTTIPGYSRQPVSYVHSVNIGSLLILVYCTITTLQPQTKVVLRWTIPPYAVYDYFW
jgi:hypothetical protein